MLDDESFPPLENVSVEDYPAFIPEPPEEVAVNVRLNSVRLESYLQAIQKKLREHDTTFQEQIEHVDRVSKLDDAKIARLAVKLDHCMMDVNAFKDSVIGQLSNNSGPAGTNTAALPSAILKMQSELEILSALVRRSELSQAEGLDSFTQIKQLTSTLKAVTRQLDSLGRNSVIMELRLHVDRVAEKMRSEAVSAQEAAEAERNELRDSIQRLEYEAIASLGQRLADLEEKSVLYDLVLNEQGGMGEEGEEMAPLVEGEEEAVVTLDLGADGEPLRPSQMLHLEDGAEGQSGKEGEYEGQSTKEGSPGQTSAVLSHNSSFRSGTPDGGDSAGELWPGARPSAAGLIDNLPPSGSYRPHRSATASNKNTSATRVSWLGGAAPGDYNGSMLVPKKRPPSGSIRGSSGNLSRASFFSNLMNQYVGRVEFAETVSELGAFSRKAVFRLKEQLQHHAASLLGASLVRILRSLLLWKRDRAFKCLRENVAAWHAVRSRRYRAKALLFQACLAKISSRYTKLCGFRYWARMTCLFNERERLRLYLRNVLQHWINMRVINVRIYLNRWKRSTVFSYHSSLFGGDEGELEATGISDDFRRLLDSDNFSLRAVKQIAKDDMRRRWGLRERQERLLVKQEAAIREHVAKITASMAGGELAEMFGGGGKVKSAEITALREKTAEVEESLQQMRQDQRRVINNMEASTTEVDAKIEAEGQRVTNEFNLYRSQVAVRFNDCKEGLVNLQADIQAQFAVEQHRMTLLEDRLKHVDRRLDAEESKIAPMQAEQHRMMSLLDAVKSELRITDTQVDALSGKIERAAAASLSTVDSNKRLERVLTENAEYYDVELKFMRAHVAETVSGLAELREEKRQFVQRVEDTIGGMLTDLNSFVERLPSGNELYAICREYEEMWVRLHYEGAGSTPQLANLPDALHTRVAQAALRIAHHIAAAADRLVLARWTAAFTAKRAVPNPQDAPAARTRTGSSVALGLTERPRPALLSETRPETAEPHQPTAASLGRGQQVEAAWGTPSVDLVEQVREELLQNYLAEGLIALLRAADEVDGPPGILKSTGRATFQRKLKRAIEAALTKHNVMMDPAQTSAAAALSLGRMSRKQQHSATGQPGHSTAQATGMQHRLAALGDACVSCGHELITSMPVLSVPPAALLAPTASTLHMQPGKAGDSPPRRTYAYPTTVSAATGAFGATRTEPALTTLTSDSAGLSGGSDEPPRPDSPMSQISVTIRRSPLSFAPPPDLDKAVPLHTVYSGAPLITAGGSTKTRPHSASAIASTRHREAVKQAQLATSATAASLSMAPSAASVNMRSVGRETAVLGQAASTSTAQAPRARLAAGFDVPQAAAQQSSAHLAEQLANRFRQDASFQGTDVRKVDAGELLGSLHTSRRLFGAHSSPPN